MQALESLFCYICTFSKAILIDCFSISTNFTILVSSLPNDKTTKNPAKSELENALISFTLDTYGGFVCTGFFINDRIVTFSYDCYDNLIGGDDPDRKHGDFINLTPFYKDSKLFVKNLDVMNKTIGFMEVGLFIIFYQCLLHNYID